MLSSEVQLAERLRLLDAVPDEGGGGINVGDGSAGGRRWQRRRHLGDETLGGEG